MSVSATLIGAAVKTAVEALPNANGYAVEVRKTPALPPGKLPPAIVVVVNEDVPLERLFKTVFLALYPVSVVIVTAGGAQLGDDATLRQLRKDIEGALLTNATYASVTGFNVAQPRAGAAYNRAALDAALNYSPVNVTVEVEETRP